MKTAELRIHISFLPPLVSPSLLSPALTKNQRVVFILTRKLRPTEVILKLENNSTWFNAKGCTVNRDAWFPKFRHTNDENKVNPESPSYELFH